MLLTRLAAAAHGVATVRGVQAPAGVGRGRGRGRGGGEGGADFGGTVVGHAAGSAITLHAHFTAYPWRSPLYALSALAVRATFTVLTKTAMSPPFSSLTSPSTLFPIAVAACLSTFAVAAHTQQAHILLGVVLFLLPRPDAARAAIHFFSSLRGAPVFVSTFVTAADSTTVNTPVLHHTTLAGDAETRRRRALEEKPAARLVPFAGVPGRRNTRATTHPSPRAQPRATTHAAATTRRPGFTRQHELAVAGGADESVDEERVEDEEEDEGHEGEDGDVPPGVAQLVGGACGEGGVVTAGAGLAATHLQLEEAWRCVGKTEERGQGRKQLGPATWRTTERDVRSAT